LVRVYFHSIGLASDGFTVSLPANKHVNALDTLQIFASEKLRHRSFDGRR
jgi:hypothetical protein